ncbi:magnesium/cobalt transporter CorA [Virgibacillus halophilus]|uniref:Magnesium transport protein CorA n=1 Tax=Tigheibacillus halophilus TaxID=361280 RepID=A0ABU5C212_9BACI|nr:magnesium/cobalt transporter CorA [Virgibacillus halophilus]
MIRIAAVTENNQLILNLTLDTLHLSNYSWCWIDYNDPTAAEIRLLSTKLHFHPLAIEDCTHGNQRPKLDYYDDFSFFVTHTAATASSQENQINFFLAEKCIVSYHKQDLEEINQVWKQLSLDENAEAWDKYRIFYEVMDNVVDNFFPVISSLEEQINEVEENTENNTMDVLLDRLFDLRHQLLELRHSVNPVRDLFYRIVNSHHLKGIQERREYFVDIYDHLLKISQLVDSNREITSDIRESFISRNSYQQNKVIQMLTIVTFIFAPLTFIAGIYGMNFTNMPELKWHYGYPLIMGFMLLITIGMVLWFKKKGWW